MNFEMNDFGKDVLDKSFETPILVDFWAEWCGPCKMLGPVLEKLAAEAKDWRLVKVNSDEHPELAAQYGIRSIPNVKLFSEGKVINEFVGALPEKAIKDWLKKAVPGKNGTQLIAAESLISTGEEDKAEKVLENILKAEPDNEKAKVILARILFFKDAERSLSLVKSIDEGSEYFETVNSLRSFAGLFELKDNPDNLPDSQTKFIYLEATSDLQKKNFDSALEKFIEVIRIDRQFDDDGARKACIAIFKYLGEENEITLRHRRYFGSALYI